MTRKLARGIYRTPSGFRAFVRVRATNGQTTLVSKRFPKTATLTAMKAWREDRRAEARKVPVVVARPGTLAEDIARYLQLVAAMPTLAWRRRDLYAWRAVFGDLARSAITPAMIRQQLHTWRSVGPVVVFVPRLNEYRERATPLSASACNHRRTALLHLYTVLDGKDAPNPIRGVPAFPEPPAAPRARDLAFLEAAIARLKNPAQRARAAVLLWTGIRGNSELAAMTPEHVDLEARVCHVPTGKGGRRVRLVPLNAKGVAAWQAFAAAKAWGPYDKNLLLRSFRRAVRSEAKARDMEPTAVRVYDLRHSIATAYLKAGADLADVQDMLGHTSDRMTRRYAPFQLEKLRQTADEIGRKVTP